MNHTTSLRQNIKKGSIFAILVIFMMMIGFHEIAATLVSKVFGVSVLRGSVSEIIYMSYVFVLIGFFVGWSTAGKDGKGSTRIINGLMTGLITGVIVALFDFVLVFLIQADMDIREYLTAFSIPSMRYFLLNLDQMGILAHLGIFTGMGLVGSAAAVFIYSEGFQNTFQKAKDLLNNGWSAIYEKLPPFVQKYSKFVLYAILLAAAIILPLKWGSYLNFVVGLVGLYVIAGIGLNIVVGLSGQLVLGYAAFFAMGAYSMGLLNAPAPHNIMLGFWPSLVISVLMAVAAAFLLGLPIMRLRGDYLAIVTLGFGEIIRILLKSDLLTDFTGGPRGLHDIHGPTLFGKPFTSDSDYVYLIFAALALTFFIYQRLQDSSTGRAWLAIKEDAIAAQATGINLQKYKLLALTIGAAFAGLVGGISAARNLFTGPNDHSLMVSINVLSILVVGGVNSIPGIILGAFTLKGLPEILREVENYRQLAFGALLIAMMIMRPNGLWPTSRPKMEKAERLKAEAETAKKGAKNA
jgi:ABC-type branched-subunit amino acid transport system permease subunit